MNCPNINNLPNFPKECETRKLNYVTKIIEKQDLTFIAESNLYEGYNVFKFLYLALKNAKNANISHRFDKKFYVFTRFCIPYDAIESCTIDNKNNFRIYFNFNFSSYNFLRIKFIKDEKVIRIKNNQFTDVN